jgi:hypothetical protein
MDSKARCTLEKADFRGWGNLRNGLRLRPPKSAPRWQLVPTIPVQDQPWPGSVHSGRNAGDGSLAAWKNYGGDKTGLPQDGKPLMSGMVRPIRR